MIDNMVRVILPKWKSLEDKWIFYGELGDYVRGTDCAYKIDWDVPCLWCEPDLAILIKLRFSEL